MTPNKMQTFILATILIATSGCSGSRLRNLVSRSDYRSLEELEARDALAAEKSKAEQNGAFSDSTRLASSEREIVEEESSGAPKFSLSRLFGRSDDNSELGSDPFIEPPATKNEQPVARTSAPNAVEATRTKEATVTELKKPAAPVAAVKPNFSATISDVEKQAEDMFAELSAAEAGVTESVFGNPNEGVDALAASKAEAVAKSVESGSFEEYMAQRASAKSESAATKAFFDDVQESADEVQSQVASSFYSLLNEQAPASVSKKSQAPAAFDAELFPELNNALVENEADLAAVFGAANASGKAEEAFGDHRAANSSNPQLAAADPFAEASGKHGFEEVRNKDPWASFNGSSLNSGMPWSARPSADESANAESVWSDSASPRPTPNFEVSSASAERPPVFTQVSSSSSASNNQRATFSQELEATLVIPSLVPESNPFGPDAGMEHVEEPQPVSLDSDPFFTSIPQATSSSAEELLMEETANPVVAVTNTGWASRSWFLILGCVIVALLLFMPDRQNRAKT